MNDSDGDWEIPWSVFFPLPFRVLALVGVGILGWATNLHGFSILGVDAVSAMGLRPETDQHSTLHRTSGLQSLPSLYEPLYRIFIGYSVWCLSTWALFRYATFGDLSLVDVYGFIPGVSTLLILLVLICPFNILHKLERDKFLRAIRRCLFPSTDGPIYFADVVFADIFTSFAKVLGDVWLSTRMLLRGNSLLTPPEEDSWLRWVMPTIMSLPYLIRLRQCLVEYSLPTNKSRRPLYNALKYATSFPVIFLSAAQRIVIYDLVKEKGDNVAKEAWHGEHQLFRLWLLAAAINSLYSFWWDVTNDWGLELLKPSQAQDNRKTPLRRLILPHLHSGSPLLITQTQGVEPGSHDRLRKSHPWGLRSTLLYPLPVYPLLVFLNLVLRLTWSVKLSSHLHSQTDTSVSIFCLEIAEIIRRWMWAFVRVEWEVIKKDREVPVRRNEDDLSGDEVDSSYELVPSASDDTIHAVP